jgi:hypothetical protein
MADQYEKDLDVWLAKQHETTGRFDQKRITKDTPFPTGPSKVEALIITTTMISAVRDNPTLALEISPEAPDADKPWGMGRIWCEYENACLILEMSNIQRNDGKWDRSHCRSMLSFLAHILNVKYGIDRSENSVKNQWYRELRGRSGIDERGNFGSPDAKHSRFGTNMRVSLSDTKKAKAKGNPSKTANSTSPLVKKSGIIVKFSSKK